MYKTCNLYFASSSVNFCPILGWKDSLEALGQGLFGPKISEASGQKKNFNAVKKPQPLGAKISKQVPSDFFCQKTKKFRKIV